MKENKFDMKYNVFMNRIFLFETFNFSFFALYLPARTSQGKGNSLGILGCLRTASFVLG